MATLLLEKAKACKNDEFYTQLTDIEKELSNYKNDFKDKVIFCNCDDPYESNFFKYFAMNFNYLGIKKLIATCYAGSPVSFTQISLSDINEIPKIVNSKRKAYKIEVTQVDDTNNDGAIDLSDVMQLIKNNNNILAELEGDGDFRSDECIELLKESDIVVTNPPFSLFREYVTQLEKYNKKFIIMGNTNALSYQEIFRLFKDDKIRTGYTNFNVGMYFFVPDYVEKYHKIQDGKKMVRVSTSCWFTNLPVSKHNEKLILFKKYSNLQYPKYDNYDAINVNKYTEIPENYFGKIGVPITFLDKFNPKQFKILGIMASTKKNDLNFGYPYLNGKKLFARIIIVRNDLDGDINA